MMAAGLRSLFQRCVCCLKQSPKLLSLFKGVMVLDNVSAPCRSHSNKLADGRHERLMHRLRQGDAASLDGTSQPLLPG